MIYDINIDSYIGYPISRQWMHAQLKRKEGAPVTVRINSYGGDTNTALDIRQQFIDHGKVTVHFVGMSASAATILAMGAQRITMSRHALLLIHQCMSPVLKWAYMNKEEIAQFIKGLTAKADDQSKIDQVIANIYAERTGSSLDTIKTTMSAARWLTADECLQLGLVDAITEDGEEEPLTERTLSQFQACGLPIPVRTANDLHLSADAKPNWLERISTFFQWLFECDEDINDVAAPTKTEDVITSTADGPDDEDSEEDDEPVTDDAGIEAVKVDPALEAAQHRIEVLEAELKTLRAADGDDTQQIEGTTDSADGETARYARAISSYNQIKGML